jgi:hypothetical protein
MPPTAARSHRSHTLARALAAAAAAGALAGLSAPAPSALAAGACPAGFAAVPAAAAEAHLADRNGDGRACAYAFDAPGERVTVVLDNARPMYFLPR